MILINHQQAVKYWYKYTISVTAESWRQGNDISDEKREWFRQKSIASASRKRRLTALEPSKEPLRKARLDIEKLMPTLSPCSIDSISLFSGCGGLDIGFERAGFKHVLSLDILDICGETLKFNRPSWKVLAGKNKGDIRNIEWEQEVKNKDNLLVIHGGPPCQPFSNSGRQLGEEDERNMVPEFFRAVNKLLPDAFIMENVPALGSAKFSPYLDSELKKNVSHSYFYKKFYMFAPNFGVPQQRNRLFIVGFKSKTAFNRFVVPKPTHNLDKFVEIHRGLKKHIKEAKLLGDYDQLPSVMGVREAIGLDDSKADGLAPTFRSGFTGPRSSTSILNGSSSQEVLKNMGIWGNGVAPSRESARAFPPENGTVRLSTDDVSLIQGFPSNWEIKGPVYKNIGQVGNSVAPPVAYHVAISVRKALLK